MLARLTVLLGLVLVSPVQAQTSPKRTIDNDVFDAPQKPALDRDVFSGAPVVLDHPRPAIDRDVFDQPVHPPIDRNVFDEAPRHGIDRDVFGPAREIERTDKRAIDPW
jgi:hypothetical protein